MPETIAPTANPPSAPEPVDTDRASPAGGVGDVADHGEQGWVDHGGARAEQHVCDRPHSEAVHESDQREGGGLGEHAGGDEVFAAPPVRQRPGHELPDAPHTAG